LKKTEIEVNVGDYADIEYETDPSNVELRVKYSSSNKNIATVEEDDNILSNKGGWSTVTGVSEGTCYVTVNGNTGNTAPRCTIKVVDNMWLTTDVGSGDVTRGTKVTINCKKSGATIYYTTDGTEPNKSSRKYTEPIVLTESITLKAKAYLGDKVSKTIERKYDVVAHSVGDVFTAKTAEGVDITLMVYEHGYQDIRLAVGNGSTPAIDRNYTGSITIPSSADGISVWRINEHAFDGCSLSSVHFTNHANFLILPYAFKNCSKLKSLEFPNIYKLASHSFEGCSALEIITFEMNIQFHGSKSGTITNNTEDEVFYNCPSLRKIYFTNYSVGPYAIKDWVFYCPSVDIYSLATLFVKDSDINTFKSKGGWKKFKNIKSINDDTDGKLELSANPSGGSVVSNTKVYLTASANGSTVSGADIYYTTNGSSPSKSSMKYTSSGVTITQNCTLKAIAYKDGYDTSEIGSWSYTIASKPKLSLSASPSGGSVTSGTRVYLTASANGSTVSDVEIYYTTTGFAPSKTSNRYIPSSGIPITRDTPLKAKAYKDGYEESEVESWNYTIKSSTIEPTSISVSPSTKTIKVGVTFTPTYSLTPSNATSTVTWSSDNSSIASVDSRTGLVTGIKAGTTFINATTANGKKNWCKVIVEDDGPVYVTSISLNETSLLMPINSSKPLTATVYPSNATNKSVTWSSSNEEVASVSNGKVTARKDGLAYITCKAADGSGVSASCTIYVNNGEIDEILWGTGGSMAYSTTGTVKKNQTIRIAAIDWEGMFIPDCTYYYTLDGSTPTKSSAHFTGNSNSTIVISKSCTLKAFATCDGYKDSKVKTWQFTVEAEKEKLTMSAYPSGGAVMTNSLVSLSASNSKAKIYYTLDGSAPSRSSSLYDGNTTKIVVDKSLTVKAVACGDDFEDSDVLTVNYTTGGSPSDGIVFIDKTDEGASMVFQVISANNKTCQVGISEYPGWMFLKAVAQNYSGKITIPTKVAGFDVIRISSCAFAMCDGVTSVTLPESITYMDWGAFVSCKQLKGVYSYIQIPFEIDDYAFCSDWDGTWVTGTLYVPFGTKEKYQSTSGWKNFKNIVEMAPPTKDVSISRAGYATFYDSRSAYSLPNGLNAQVVSGASNNKLTYQTLSNGVVPAGTAVMLVSDSKNSGTYTLTASDNEETYNGNNLLRGSDEATTTSGDGYHYKLSYGHSGSNLSSAFGWYWGAQNGGAFQIDGHKAWLVVPKSAVSTRGFTIDGETTGIEMIDSDNAEAVYYDLQGRRISRPTSKGVYIKNGKKITVK